MSEQGKIARYAEATRTIIKGIVSLLLLGFVLAEIAAEINAHGKKPDE